MTKIIFHFPYYIFHLSLQDCDSDAMTDEKCNMENGK